MRFSFSNVTRPKAVAKQLKILLIPFRGNVNLAHCQELTARLYGYSDWHELSKSYSIEVPSKDDVSCSPQEVCERHNFMAEKLTSADIELEIALFIIEALHPTSAKPRKLLSDEDVMSHLTFLTAPFRPNSVFVDCGPERSGHITINAADKNWGYPFRRPDLSENIRKYFSLPSGQHPTRYIELSNHQSIRKWRTQWMSNEWYSSEKIEDFFLAKALYHSRPEPVKSLLYNQITPGHTAKRGAK